MSFTKTVPKAAMFVYGNLCNGFTTGITEPKENTLEEKEIRPIVTGVCVRNKSSHHLPKECHVISLIM